MRTVGELHSGQRTAQVILLSRAVICPVQIKIRGLNPRGEGIRLFTVVVGREENWFICRHHCTVFQLTPGAVIIDQLDRGHFRVGHILIVGTINDRNIVDDDISFELALIQQHTVCRIPAESGSISGHGPEQHAAVDPDPGTRVLSQICLQILPSASHRIISAAAVEIDISVGIGLSIRTGGDLRSQPGYRHSLWNINPDANGCGSSGNIDVASQSQTRAVSTGKPRPVIIQPDGIMAKTDNIRIFFIGIGNHRALDYAAASGIMVSRDRVRRHAIKTCHRCPDIAVIPAVLIAAVQDNGGLFAHVDYRAGGKLSVNSRDSRTDRNLHVTGGNKRVPGKCSRRIVCQGPLDITVFQIDLLILIAGHKPQITFFSIAQVHLVAGKAERIGILDPDRGAAHDLAVV